MRRVDAEHREHELLCVVVNYGLGSRVLNMAKKNGISGGTIALGRGTVSGRLAELLGLTDTRKEIVFMVADRLLGRNALKMFDDELQLYKPRHGIAFTMPLVAFWAQAITHTTPKPVKEVPAACTEPSLLWWIRVGEKK